MSGVFWLQVDHYSLLVGAVMSNDVTASVTVYVNVIDINDNSPEFSDVTLVTSISEDADVGSRVTTVSATDRDSRMCLLNVLLIAYQHSAA